MDDTTALDDRTAEQAPEQTPDEAPEQAVEGQAEPPATGDLLEETLVDEVSIDGMCGVY